MIFKLVGKIAPWFYQLQIFSYKRLKAGDINWIWNQVIIDVIYFFCLFLPRFTLDWLVALPHNTGRQYNEWRTSQRTSKGLFEREFLKKNILGGLYQYFNFINRENNIKKYFKTLENPLSYIRGGLIYIVCNENNIEYMCVYH